GAALFRKQTLHPPWSSGLSGAGPPAGRLRLQSVCGKLSPNKVAPRPSPTTAPHETATLQRATSEPSPGLQLATVAQKGALPETRTGSNRAPALLRQGAFLLPQSQ